MKPVKFAVDIAYCITLTSSGTYRSFCDDLKQFPTVRTGLDSLSGVHVNF